MTIGERMREARQKRGWTQAVLGSKCNMADSAIRRYEADRGNPTIETLERIAGALGVSVSYLLGYETEFEIIPGRLKIVQVDDPNAENYAYNIEAADPEALEIGLRIFENAGVPTGAIPAIARIHSALDCLNASGQEKAVERVEELTEIPKYQKITPPQD